MCITFNKMQSIIWLSMALFTGFTVDTASSVISYITIFVMMIFFGIMAYLNFIFYEAMEERFL